MKKILFIYFFSFIFSQTDLHQKLFKYLDYFNNNGLEIEFDYMMDYEHFSKKEKCNIKINNMSKFIFQMGPKTLFFNGNDFRTYDNRTNQLFIQDIDSTILKSINTFIDIEYIASLNIEKKSFDSYQLNYRQYKINVKIDSVFYNVFFINNEITNRFNNILITELKDEIDINSIQNDDMFIMDMRRN